MISTTKSLTILLKAARYVDHYLQKDMTKYGLNPSEFVVLEVLLNKGPQTLQQIVDRMLMGNSSMTYVVDNLVTKKLVTKSPSKKDKRATTVNLTASGKRLIADIFKKHEQSIALLYKILNESEVEIMSQHLLKLGKYAQSLMEE